jgi:hypothetical protein
MITYISNKLKTELHEFCNTGVLVGFSSTLEGKKLQQPRLQHYTNTYGVCHKFWYSVQLGRFTLFSSSVILRTYQHPLCFANSFFLDQDTLFTIRRMIYKFTFVCYFMKHGTTNKPLSYLVHLYVVLCFLVSDYACFCLFVSTEVSVKLRDLKCFVMFLW